MRSDDELRADDDYPQLAITARKVLLAKQEAADAGKKSSGWDLLADVLDVTAYHAPVKSLFARQPDGKPLAYPGGLHILFGLPKSGKSYVAAIWAAQEIAAGRRVAWFDFDNQRGSIASRFRALGLTDDQIRRGLAYAWSRPGHQTWTSSPLRSRGCCACLTRWASSRRTRCPVPAQST
jgi:hypothetical protein